MLQQLLCSLLCFCFCPSRRRSWELLELEELLREDDVAADAWVVFEKVLKAVRMVVLFLLWLRLRDNTDTNNNNDDDWYADADDKCVCDDCDGDNILAIFDSFIYLVRACASVIIINENKKVYWLTDADVDSTSAQQQQASSAAADGRRTKKRIIIFKTIEVSPSFLIYSW